ncbi:MAG TPA: hypothetical protein VM889_01420 [Candidatus Thermoplasmatota archaeon]|nr:hypothetical protein [Candidatus Thermoplasmatota archaeon]
MRRVVYVVALAAAALAAGCIENSGRYDLSFDMAWEMREPGLQAHAAAGQLTCLESAALREETLACLREASPQTYPVSGIRVLDGFYVAAGPRNPADAPGALAAWDPDDDATTGPTTLTVGATRGWNPHRATEGLVADAVWPGPGSFIAALGFWDNLDGDAHVDFQMRGSGTPAFWHPTNEWAGVPGARVAAYVEPGSHPSPEALVRPTRHEPDFWFEPETILVGSRDETVYYRGPAFTTVDVILFTDGSLFRSLEVTTVSDPILAPDARGRPFTATDVSRVDIDDYAAVAPGPVAALYAVTLQPTMDTYGTPSTGLCPNACRVEPVRAPGTPVADLEGRVWGRYPREVDPDEGSSASGRHADFVANHRAFIDVLPRTSYTGAGTYQGHGTALVGRASDGRHTVGPGTFALEAWTGLWHDANEDGFVGRATPDDPYEGGSRPHPDDYWQSSGEFFGVWPRGLTDYGSFAILGFNVTIFPDEDWGPSGIFIGYAGVPVTTTRYTTGQNCERGWIQAGSTCIGGRVTGTTRLPMRLQKDTVAGRDATGHFLAFANLWMPQGSPGFTVCTDDPLSIRFRQAGIDVEEPLWDCDHYPRWEGPT